MKKLIIILVPLLLAAAVRAETLGGLIDMVHNRGIYFDYDRFDTTTVKEFANDAAELIATLGRTNQSQSTIVLTQDILAFALPSDYLFPGTAILSADPDGDPDGENHTRRRLNYVPIDQYGTKFAAGTGRPEQFSIWNDSLILERPSLTGSDTVWFFYFSTPTTMSADTSTVDLPDTYLPILREVLVQMCMERITAPSRSPREEGLALLQMIKEALLGREADQN